MFLRSTLRKKNGKEHEYFSIVETKRLAAGKVVQLHVLYLGEINSTQQAAWRKTIEIFTEGQVQPQTVALFPEDRAATISGEEVVRPRLQDLQLKRPRQSAILHASDVADKVTQLLFHGLGLRPAGALFAALGNQLLHLVVEQPPGPASEPDFIVWMLLAAQPNVWQGDQLVCDPC